MNLFYSFFGSKLLLYVGERRGDEGRRDRLAEDCYIDPNLLSHVVPYSGPHLKLLLLGQGDASHSGH